MEKRYFQKNLCIWIIWICDCPTRPSGKYRLTSLRVKIVKLLWMRLRMNLLSTSALTSDGWQTYNTQSVKHICVRICIYVYVYMYLYICIYTCMLEILWFSSKKSPILHVRITFSRHKSILILNVHIFSKCCMGEIPSHPANWNTIAVAR